ncbi:MAG: YitT family protein [Fusobacteriaceae bacterium]
MTKTKYFKEFSMITLGSAIYAFGINYFYVSNELAEGGVTGISLILHYLFKFPISITYIIINIPLVILGWKMLGREFILKTIYGIAVVAFFIKLTSGMGSSMEDILLGSLFGGLLSGLGLGLVFLAGGSTGGVDIIARIMTKYKGISVGKALLIIDFLVLCMAGFLFGKIMFMYTVVAVYVATQIIDFVEEGKHVAKGVMVISEKNNEIKEFIIDGMNRSATFLNATGAYSGENKAILYCVMSKYEIFRFKKEIRELDPRAFVIVSDVTEVLGEGFRNIKEE